MENSLKRVRNGDFPGGPVVKTSPSNAGGEGSIHGRELRSHMPRGQKTKTENRSNLVTDSIKTLKMVHIKKLKKKVRDEVTDPAPQQTTSTDCQPSASMGFPSGCSWEAAFSLSCGHLRLMPCGEKVPNGEEEGGRQGCPGNT